MLTKRRAHNAVSALESGDFSKVIGVVAKAVEDWLPLVTLALRAGFALGQATNKGDASPEAVEFLRFLAEVPVTAEGFRTLRQRLGISQDEIAEICAVSRAVVSDWERGKAKLPQSAILALLELATTRLEQVQQRPPPIGRDIARIRKALGMRQTDLAAALGVSEIAVRKWEQHSDKPLAPSTVRRIQHRLDELEARASAAS